MSAFVVILNNKIIDTVFYVGGVCEEEVRVALINHDGYDPNIVVKREILHGRKGSGNKDVKGLGG